MIHSTLHKIYSTLKDQRILLSFHGLFSQQIMVEYGRILKERNELDENKRTILFSIFVELTENILRYSTERVASQSDSRGVGIIVVSETDETYAISSGNLVETDQARKLVSYCESLNKLDRDALKSLYKEKRREARKEGAKGAGLGLIEMTRRSDRPIICSQKPLEDSGSFLSISIEIEKSEVS